MTGYHDLRIRGRGRGESGMRIGTLLLAVLAAGAAALPAAAHHVISEVYDMGRTITVQGQVDRVGYRDPHSFLHLRVPGGGNGVRTWSVELEGAAKLQQLGVDRETLRSGDRITVCGNPGRDAGQYRLLALVLARPSDGLAVRRTPMANQRECDSLPAGGAG